MAEYSSRRTQPNPADYDPYSPLHYQTPPSSVPLGPARLASSYDKLDVSPETERARAEAETKSALGTIVLYSAPVFVVTAGSALVLLAYIFLINQWRKDGLAITTTADLQNLLTISEVLTTVVSKTVPIVLGVLAYQLASDWLKASVQGTNDRPSPLQLSLLISALQGANPVAYVKARLHISQVTKESKAQTLSSPHILRRAVSVLGTLLFFSYAIHLLDTWLHVSSRAAFFTSTTPYPSSLRSDFGRQVNMTRCTADSAPYDDSTQATYNSVCGLVIGGQIQFQASVPEGLRTLSNSSTSNKVALADDATAMLVPSYVIPSDNVRYSALTVGVLSSCQSVTSQCVYQDQGGNWGSEVGPNIRCTGTPLLNITSTSGTTFGVVDPASGNLSNGAYLLNTTSYEMAKTNPFHIAAIISSEAYATEMDPTPGFIGDSGFFQEGRNGAWNILYCNVSIRDVTYDYTPPFSSATNSAGEGTYKMTSWTNASPRVTSLLAAYVDSPWLQISQRVEGAGYLGQSMTYVDAYAQELSRELVAFSASIWEPSQVLSVQNVEQKLGSRVQIIPLALYVSAVLLYSIFTLVVAIYAAIAARSTSFVNLAQRRITSPIGLVHQLFGPIEPSRTWKEGSLGIFSVESEADRLDVGPNRAAFSVTRGNHMS
ncbi:hypothetical protein FRB94_008286 [Tulasnella sp. JGI-2019a]|nr:hypothetical protein FRB94_008286 [Tulasnella sp. JGI-2019a]